MSSDVDMRETMAEIRDDDTCSRMEKQGSTDPCMRTRETSCRLENAVEALQHKLDAGLANLTSRLDAYHTEIVEQLSKAPGSYVVEKPQIESLYAAPHDTDSSIYTKLKRRYGTDPSFRKKFPDRDMDSPPQQKTPDDVIKLTCYDFKVTEPLGLQELLDDEETKKSPWWNIFCICSILPEDDPQAQIHTDRHEREKRKAQKTIAPGPIAEGTETTPVPSIMVSPIIEEEDTAEMIELASVVVRPRTDSPREKSDPVRLPDTERGKENGSLCIDSESEMNQKSTFLTVCYRIARVILWDTIYPTSTFRTRWDLYMLILFAYVCFVSPYIICFGIEFTAMSLLGLAESAVNCSFALDIFLNFRTAYIDETNRPVVCRREIAKQYARTWLFIDVISIVPFDVLVTNKSLGLFRLFKAARIAKIVKIVRLLKIVKMMRIVKIPTQIRHLETMFSKGLMRLLTSMSAAILVTHLCACFFYYSSYLEGFHEDTWVRNSGLDMASNFHRYVTALYWSMSTLTTVGYGDVIPGNSNEKIMSMLGMVIGVTVFAYFMGSMSAMMSSLNNANTRITKRTVAMEEFLKKRKVPPHLAERVRTFFHHILSRQIVVEETSVINGNVLTLCVLYSLSYGGVIELSLPLRTELILYLYRDILGGVPFFRGKDPQFIVRTVPLLKLEYYGPGEVVIRQGDPGDVMYFVAHGHLEVRVYCDEERQDDGISNDNHNPTTLDLPNAWKTLSSFGTSDTYKKIGKLKAGEYFGEYSCLLGEYRTATVVAEDYCELYSLSRSDLDTILDEMPELGKEFLKMVEGYVAEGVGEGFLNPSIKRFSSKKNIKFQQSSPATSTSITLYPYQKSDKNGVL